VRGKTWLALSIVVGCGGVDARPKAPVAPREEVTAEEVRPEPSRSLSGRTITLIEPGEAPRRKLRYRFKAPKQEWLVTDEQITLSDVIEGRKKAEVVHLPPTTERYRIDERRVLPTGDLVYDGRIDSVDVSAQTSNLRNKVREWTTPLVGLRFSGVVDPRGNNRDADVEKPKGVISVEAQRVADRTRRGLLDMGFLLPEEEVGVGARWVVELPSSAVGMQSVRAGEYTLRAMTEDALTLDAKTNERFSAATTSFQSAEFPEVTVTVGGFSGAGTEQITVPLDGLVGRGAAHWVAKTELLLQGPERTVRVHRTMTVDVTFGPPQ